MTPSYSYRRCTVAGCTFLAWRAVATAAGEYTEAASEFWGVGFDRLRSGELCATLLGPSLEPRTMASTGHTVSWGAEFPAHYFLPAAAKPALVGRAIRLDVDGAARRVRIGRNWFDVPAYDDVECLVEALLASGELAFDSTVARVLAGEPLGLSDRQVRRRVKRVTGLGKKQLAALRRARDATGLVKQDRPLSEVAVAAGYADQAHMTRAMRRIAGLTPGRLADAVACPFSSRPLDS